MAKKPTYRNKKEEFLSVEECLEKIKELELENQKLILENKNAAEKETKYKSLFEMSDDAILVIENNTFVDCNLAVVKMLGYKTKQDLLNTHPSELSPEKQPDGRMSYEKAQEMMAIALKNGSHRFEWIHTKANGENFPVEVRLSKVEFEDKVLINTIWRDLTEKKKAEEIILKNIEEKEILLKEIHHRVKNNLQIITSLLNLQANSVDSESVKAILFQSKSRIESMCKVHEMLYGSKDLSSINYKTYLNDLLSKLILNSKGETDSIKLKLEVDNLFVNINTAIPLGLLINEVVTNALKYAFPDNNEGEIYVKINPTVGSKFELKIGDNGVGYEHTKTFDTSNSLGFQLILSLADQLNGEITRDLTKKGTHYCLIFEKFNQ